MIEQLLQVVESEDIKPAVMLRYIRLLSQQVNKMSSEQRLRIWNAINNRLAKSAGSRFRYNVAGWKRVFVQCDKTSEDVWKEYRERMLRQQQYTRIVKQLRTDKNDQLYDAMQQIKKSREFIEGPDV